MAIYSDLNEIKKILQIDPNNHNEDVQLALYNEWVGNILEEILDRSFVYQTRTWYYPGTGTIKLPLKHRPVYPTSAPARATSLPYTALQVTIDEGGNFGFASGSFTLNNGAQPLVLGVDYTIRVDQDNGGSREAILYRINDLWPKNFSRIQGLLSPFVSPDLGSIQVISTAGYTVDMLPGMFRMAADMLIARLAYLFPLGMQTSSESYIDRSIALTEDNRRYLLNLARPYVINFRNWSW